MIADPVDDAQRRIDAALQHLDAHVRKAVATYKGDDGSPGDWGCTVDVPMRGPGYLGFVITDNAFCGVAHPSTATMAILYDLHTGVPVDRTRLLPPSLTGKVALAAGLDDTRARLDDTRMVTLASKRSYSRHVAGYDLGSGNAEYRASCKEALPARRRCRTSATPILPP